MAQVVFTKTNEGLVKSLSIGAGFGGLVAITFLFDENFNSLVGVGVFLAFLLAFGIGGLLASSYRASCSSCGADLTTFCHHPDRNSLIHCPACGKKFSAGA